MLGPGDTTADASACANLAVKVDEISASEARHVEQWVRQFLQQQFLKTSEILRNHGVNLAKIVATLTENSVLLHDGFLALRHSAELGSSTPRSYPAVNRESEAHACCGLNT